MIAHRSYHRHFSLINVSIFITEMKMFTPQIRDSTGKRDYSGSCDYQMQKGSSPLATEITKMGFATWSLEYRRIGNEGGGWRAILRL